MTYLDILTSALKFAMTGQINDMILDVCYDMRSIDENRKMLPQEAQMRLSYLALYVLKSKGLLTKETETIFKYLENKLTDKTESLTKTFEKAFKSVEQEMNTDEKLVSLGEALDSGELDEETSGIINVFLSSKVIEGFNNKMQDTEWDKEVLTSAIDNTLYYAITAMADLFFTTKGYSYLPQEFHIADDELRNKCFNYFRNIITDYYYKRFCLDIPGLGLLVGVLKIIDIIFFLISQEEYERLDKFFAIDKTLIDASYPEKVYYDRKPSVIVSLLYNTEKTKELDLEDEFSQNWHNDPLLDMLLSDNSFMSIFDSEQIAIILLCYFKCPNKKRALNNIERDLAEVQEILRSNDTLHNKRRRILRVKLDNS